MLGSNGTYLASKRLLSIMLVASLLLTMMVFVISPGPVLAGFYTEYQCRIEPCGGVSDRAWYMRWCGTNSSPPCGDWFFQVCGCPG